MITESEFKDICRKALDEFRQREPYKNGHMAKDATKLEFPEPFTAKLYIDPEVAPYSVYTVIDWADTSPTIKKAPRKPELLGKSSFLWTDGDKPHGQPKKNPNQGWIDRAVAFIAKYIAAEMKGTLSDD